MMDRFPNKLWFGQWLLIAGAAALFGAACSGDDGPAAQSGSNGGQKMDAGAGGKPQQGTGGRTQQGTGGGTATDAADDAALPGSFVIANGGETKTITFPDGAFLKFVFPASAAGKRVRLRIVDDATLGLEGKFPHLVEMLPHGLTFDPPVLVTPDWTAKVPVLKTFADAPAAAKPDVLAIAADKAAFELPHFSYISVEGIDFNCPFPGSSVIGSSTVCKATQYERSIYCDNTQECRAIRAHCCLDSLANSNFDCTELLDYADTPINWPPCGNAPNPNPRDASPDVIDPIGRPDSGRDGSAQGGAGGATPGTGGAAQGNGGSSGPGNGGASQGGAGGNPDGDGCPLIGYYTPVASGACGNLDTNADLQRLDGRPGCLRYWEFDTQASSNGIASGALTYNATGPSTGLPINLGSTQYTCTASVTGGSVTLVCTGTPGTCTVSLTYTGPLI
jgi:hypothetical protein